MLSLRCHEGEYIVITHEGEELYMRPFRDRFGRTKLAFQGPMSFRIDRRKGDIPDAKPKTIPETS